MWIEPATAELDISMLYHKGMLNTIQFRNFENTLTEHFFIFKIYQTEKNSNIKFTTIYGNPFSFRITFDWSGTNTQIYIYTRHTHPFTCSLCSLWNIHVEFIAVVSNDYDFFGQENIQFTFPLRYFKSIL